MKKYKLIDIRNELEELAKRLNLNSLEEAIHFPQYFQVETAHCCNGDCVYCTVRQWDISKKFMDDDLFYKIADEIIEYKDFVKRVCVARGGEPLLDRKLTSRIKYLKENGIRYVNISTNVSLLDEKISIALLSAGLNDIMMSIDSVCEETYKKIRRGLDFHTVIKNAKRYIKLRDEICPSSIIRIRGVMTEENANEKEEWEKYWNSILKPHDRIYFKKMHTWGNLLQGAEKPKKEDYSYEPCVALWSSMNITVDGKIALCNADYEAKKSFGDINNSSIREVWQSAGYDKIRKLHASGNRNEMSFCRGCKIWDINHVIESKRDE